MDDRSFIDWIDTVATGGATMSQRNLKWVDANGDLKKLIDAAKRRGVHLVQLTVDKDHQLVAASPQEFATLC